MPSNPLSSDQSSTQGDAGSAEMSLSETINEARLPLKQRLRKFLIRAVGYGTLSLIIHLATILIGSNFSFDTNIGDAIIEWSQNDLTGVGMATDPMKGPDKDGVTASVTEEEVEAMMEAAEPRVEPDEREEIPQPAPGEGDLPIEDVVGGGQPKDRANTSDPEKKNPNVALPTNPSDKPPASAEDGKGTHPAESLPGLAAYGPGNVRIIFMVHNEPLRGTDFEEPLRKMLKRFPDYQLTLQGSDFDPINELDGFLIASNNLRRLSQTFVALRHHNSDEKMKALFDRTFMVPLAWEKFNGNWMGVPQKGPAKVLARNLYFPAEGLSVLVNKDLLPSLEAKRYATPEGGGKKVLQRTWLESLQSLEGVGNIGGSKPALLISAKHLSLRFSKDFPAMPTAKGLTFSMTADPDPLITLRLEFSSEAEASQFREAWPKLAKAVQKKYPFVFGLEKKMRRFDFEQNGIELFAQGKLPGVIISLVLNMITGMLPDIRL